MGGGPPGFRRGFTCPALLGIPEGREGAARTGLSPSAAGLSRPLRSPPPGRSPGPATPPDGSGGLGVVRVRSPLLAESLLISSPRGTEMFHFPRSRLRGLFHSPADGAHTRAGLLHSETHGSTVACTSPWTIAACRVLRRLLSPRHPSCARRACPPESLPREASRALLLSPCF